MTPTFQNTHPLEDHVSGFDNRTSPDHLAIPRRPAIFSVLAIRDRVAPPTINLDDPDVATPIDLVPHKARKRDIDVVLSNSFGFGGTNASLVFRRADA